MERRAGLIQFQVDGERYDAKGNFSYNLGVPKRETIVGSDGIHGFKEVPQPAFIEGEVTDSKSLNLKKLVSIEDATVVLQLFKSLSGAPGKVIALRNGTFTGEGTGNSEEGNIGVRFEGPTAEEITP